MPLTPLRFRALTLVSALLCAGASAQERPAPKAKPAKPAPAAKAPAVAIPDIPYTRFVLKNGLTLLVHEDHKSPVVAINTWYHVGSKNEKPGKTGFAHLFEHLMFGGSNNFKHNYIQAMEAIGCTDLNGTTNNDRTNYFENVPTSMLDYALFAESDRMGHLLPLDPKKLDLQRGVVQNEKRQGDNEPYGCVEQLLVENTWPAGHPYSWTVIGSMKDLDAASMDDVAEWFRTYYGPNNTVLVLAGDITPAEALKKVEKYYGELPPGPPISKHTAWVAKRTGTHRGWVQDRVPQARIYRVWNVPQAGAPEEALLDLAAQILGRGKTSRLYKRLVYQDQLASAAVAYNASQEIAGQFNFVLTARPGADAAKMERAADEELRRFLKEGPTAAELERAKTRILGGAVRTMERVGGFGGKSDLLAQSATFLGNPDAWKDGLERIRAATPEQVRRAAAEWLSDGDYVLEVQPYPAQLQAGARLDRSQEPAKGAAMSLNLPPMQRATLSNGLKVVLAERHAAPVVNVSLMVDSGACADPDGLPGLASLAQRMLEEGTATRDSAAVSETFEALGAHFSAAVNLDWSIAGVNTLKATLDASLATFADVVLHPAFAQKEFERLQKERIAQIKREKVQPQTIGLRLLPGLVFGQGHPYARSFTNSGTEDAVARMTREDLAKYHATWFKPNNATLLVVGDTTLDEIRPRLEKLFATWKPGPVPTKSIPAVPSAPKPIVYLIDRPGSAQSLVFGAQLAPPSSSPDAVAIDMINDVYGGQFSSRINMNIREDKHWSYGAYAMMPPTRAQRLYVSMAPVQGDKTRETLQELMKEVQGIAGARPITAEELQAAQQNATLGLPGSFETAAQLGGRYANILMYGLPEDHYNTFTQRVLALTPGKANAVAAQFVQPQTFVWVVVGDMAKIEAGVRDLNMGDVRKIDVDGNPVK